MIISHNIDWHCFRSQPVMNRTVNRSNSMRSLILSTVVTGVQLVARRTHAVQYISMPDNDWEKLRNQFPAKYEKAVNPTPDPDEWFHARIVLKGTYVSVYVNDAKQPSLEVERSSAATHSGLGLWVGNNSPGSFADFRFRK